MASSVALAVAVSTPAGAMQFSAGAGNAPDANVIQVQDKGHGGRSGGHFSGGGSGGPSGGPSVSTRGNFSGPSARGNFEARGQVQTRDLPRGNIQPRGELSKKDLPRGEVHGGDWNKKEWDRKDFSRWQGSKPHIVHRGWDRHHKHRFFGAFLIGVPYGYYAVVSNPCYDWFYGPQGWGYYWNYDRCPV
jgi:hypothetical protein